MNFILVALSILFPIFVGLSLLFLRQKISRVIIVIISALFLMFLSIGFLLATPFDISLGEIGYIDLSTIIAGCDLILLGIMMYISIVNKKMLPSILVIIQIAMLLYIELNIKPYYKEEFKSGLFLCDHLSLVMMLLILIIGSLIAIFSLRYINDFEKHSNIEKSRQPFFFFIVFVFLGAMSGVVLSNNLLNMYFFWELTTLCSFLLISYDKSPQAKENAFRALWMNLLGGVAFIFAIVLLFAGAKTIRIDQIIDYGLNYGKYAVIALPLALLTIAAFTKAAQFPFQSWLLGAMVAPTPVSALLHSSTMVKAGVYLLVRFSPLFMGRSLGYAVAVIGGFTFFAASALAIGQSNAKKVLAYSTIANLGLIVATAGIGTPLAVTAAVLLIIFHAVSKALLFLCVGTIEHGIGSRDVEDMDGLISKMPLIGTLTVIGMFSMLLPPFGVIITKLLGIEAAANVPVVLLFLVMGSAFTVVFWAKWMGKILTISNIKEQKVENYSLYTILPLGTLALMVVLVSVGIIQINNWLVVPYIASNWIDSADINLYGMMLIPIFIAILCLVSLIPIFIKKTKPNMIRSPYLCGENVCDEISFLSASDTKHKVTVGNFYFEQFFKEDKLSTIANIFAIAFILFMFGVTLW